MSYNTPSSHCDKETMQHLFKSLGAKAPQLRSFIWASVMQSRSFQTQLKDLPSPSCSCGHFHSLMAEDKQSARATLCCARCNAHTAAGPNMLPDCDTSTFRDAPQFANSVLSLQETALLYPAQARPKPVQTTAPWLTESSLLGQGHVVQDSSAAQ